MKQLDITRSICDLLFNHRLAVLLTWLILFTLALLSATRLQFKEDIFELLPKNDPVIEEFLSIAIGYNRQNMMLIDISVAGKESAITENELISGADDLVERMNATDHFESIQYRFDLDEFADILEVLKSHRAGLFAKEDEMKIVGLLSTDSIFTRIENLKRNLTETPAPFLLKSFYSDPFGIDGIFLKKLDMLRSMNNGVVIDRGRLFTRDKRHLLIIAQPLYESLGGSESALMVKEMQDIIETTINDSRDSIRIAYISGHRIALENETIIKKDLRLTITVSLIAISLLALLVFRNPLLVLLTLIPAGVGITFSLGIINCIKPSVSAISLGGSTILIGIAVDYGIHLLYHYDHMSGTITNREQVILLVHRLMVPIMLSVGTTVLALLTLQFSFFPGYRELGIITVLGIISAALFALLGLPLLLPERGKIPRKRIPILPLDKIITTWFLVVRQRKRIVLSIVVIITLVSGIGLTRVGFDGNIENLRAVSNDLQRDIDQITSSFKLDNTSVSIGIRGCNLDELLTKNEKIFNKIKNWEANGKIISCESIAPLIPSTNTQVENQQRWQNWWNEDRLKLLILNADSACKRANIKPQNFHEAISNLPGETMIFAPEMFLKDEKHPLNKMLSSLLHLSEDENMILTNVKLKNQEDYSVFEEKIRVVVPDVILYNGSNFMRYLIHLIFSEMKKLGGIALLLILILLGITVRKTKSLLPMILTLLISIIWTFGLMGLLGIKFNLMNSIVVIFIFGLVIDYIIFLTMAWEKLDIESEQHLVHAGGAILISALTTMFGFGALALSHHPAFHSLGLTALLGIGNGLIAAMFIVPLTGSKRKTEANLDVTAEYNIIQKSRPEIP